jgi:hypothetical protein
MLQINSSIAKHQGRLWCVYRTKNLFEYDSESYLEELNIDFETISSKRLTAENNNTAFEDVRLFSFDDKLLAFYTFLPLDKDGKWAWIYRIGYGEVNVLTGIIENQQSLHMISTRDNEKNWIPYVFKQQLYLITDFEPYLRIINIDPTKKTNTEFFLSETKTKGWEFGELRGGTALLAHPNNNDGWLYGFVHSYLMNVDGFSRYYYYTVVRLKPVDMQFQYWDKPIPHPEYDESETYEQLWKYSNYKTLKVIFPMSIMYYDNGLLMSYGRDDVTSDIEYFSWDYILSLFS